MKRTREIADKIAQTIHGEMDCNFARRVLISHYMRSFDWACVNCGNTGSVVDVVGQGKIRTSDCMCRIIHRRNVMSESIRARSNIPSRYHDADLKTYINTGKNDKEKLINACSFNVIDAYAKSLTKILKKGYGLYLTGPNGVGKTFLSCAIGNKAISCGHSVKFYTMSTIIQTEIRGWRDDDARATMAGIKDADFLLIDDLDKVYRTKTQIESALFDNLLRERLQNNKPCIFTSNRTIVDAGDDYGPHIYSMLIEHCAELVFVGEDHRRNMSDMIRKDILSDS